MPRPKAPTAEERAEMAAQTAAEERSRREQEGTYVSPSRAGSVEPPLMDEDSDQGERLEEMSEEEDLLHDEGIWSEVRRALLPPRGLHAKLAEIMEIAGRIPKKGTAPAAMGGYKFVQVGDAADPIRKALAERGVTMMPHELETVDLSYGMGKNQNMNMHTIKMTWRLTDSETGEFFDLPSFGTGGDTGDKFSPKAQTNAMKYALLMGFMLSTGDDPEAADLSDKPEGAGITINASSVPGVIQGGRQNKATDAQLEAIRAMARGLELTPESMSVLIAAALGGKGPDIDNLETQDAYRAIRNFLGELSFAEAGSVVQALQNTAPLATG